MAKPFQRILVPMDFSRHSKIAREHACMLAAGRDASVILMHAYVVPAYTLPEGYITASPEVMTELLTKTQSAMQEERARCLSDGAPAVETVITEGPAFAEIIRVARDKQVDLIVMGTHGRTGLKHALLGSVAEKVVRKAPCAVLTVRDLEHEFERP